MGLRRLSTGEVGIPGSADTVNAGGQKIAGNFHELYNAYGDLQLVGVYKDVEEQEEYITLHTTGYHQRHAITDYANPVATGSMHDIDSSLSIEPILDVQLPEIVKSYTGMDSTKNYARIGDKIEFMDTASSWSVNPIRFSAKVNQFIDSQSTLLVDQSYCKIIFTCIDDITWTYKIEPIAGIRGKSAIDESVVLDGTGVNFIPLSTTNSYDLLKLIVYASEYSPVSQTSINWSSCEILILNDKTSTVSTRYSINETNTVVDIGTTIQDGFIGITATQVNPESRVLLTVTSVQAIKARGVFRSIVDRKLSIAWDL